MMRALALARLVAVLCAPGLLAACGAGDARDSIRAVGSSTVYPFAKMVAESFARSYPEFKSPIIESTGTGGGIALFCSGLGSATPDIANASRKMTLAEFEDCQANGVHEVTELQVGLDGLAFASARGGIDLDLTPRILYRALAANPFGQPQTARTWADVEPSLPDRPIFVYGPPSTSGTRDSLKELVLIVGCETDPAMRQLKQQDRERFDRLCTEIRFDGAYVDQGEQDNLIVQKIEGNPLAIGVFGFSFLEENIDKVEGKRMNGIAPTYENIARFAYPTARPLFIYIKNAHLDAVPGLREFVAEWVKLGVPGGALSRIGLVANGPEQAERSRAAAAGFVALGAADFE